MIDNIISAASDQWRFSTFSLARQTVDFIAIISEQLIQTSSHQIMPRLY
jgi:hypothetical protein